MLRIGLLLCLSMGLGAQEEVQRLPSGLQWEHVQVSGSGEVAVALLLPTGFQQDPQGRNGLAEVLAFALAMAQQDQAGKAFQVEALATGTMLWQSFSLAELAGRLGFLLQVLQGELALTADQLAMVLGRARLAADDATWLYPGPMLRQMARQQCMQAPPLGRAEELEGLTLADLQQRLRNAYGPQGAWLVSIGDMDSDAWQSKLSKAMSGLTSRPSTSQSFTAKPMQVAQGKAELSRQHPRLQAPYVAAALMTPAAQDADYPAFLLAVTALRYAAFDRFSQSGMLALQAQAKAPFLHFRVWDGDSLLVLHRRGVDGVAVALPEKQLRRLLTDLARDGVPEHRLPGFRHELRSTLALPPYKDRGRLQLEMRVRVLAFARQQGWPADLDRRLAQVEAEQINRVLRQYLAPERFCWLRLLPQAQVKPNSGPPPFRLPAR